MEQFLSYQYYFNPFLTTDFRFSKITLTIIVLIFLSGLAWGYYRKKGMKDKIARKILRPYPGKLINFSLLAFVLLAIREANIPYLSMRILWVVLVAYYAYQMIRLALTYSAEYEKRAKKVKEQHAKKTYLPKKK